MTEKMFMSLTFDLLTGDADDMMHTLKRHVALAKSQKAGNIRFQIKEKDEFESWQDYKPYLQLVGDVPDKEPIKCPLCGDKLVFEPADRKHYCGNSDHDGKGTHCHLANQLRTDEEWRHLRALCKYVREEVPEKEPAQKPENLEIKESVVNKGGVNTKPLTPPPPPPKGQGGSQ